MGQHSTEHPPDNLGARSIVGATQRVTGFEPTAEQDLSALVPITSANGQPVCAVDALRVGGTDCPCLSSFGVDLKTVIELWEAMTVDGRQAVLAFVHVNATSSR